jgi:ABC-2 type transport system permease protein
VAPLRESEILGALALGGLTRGLVVGLVTFLTGETFYFFINGTFIAVTAPLWFLIFVVLGGLSFALFGVCVAFWAKTFDQLSAVTGFILLPLIYLGGVFFSTENLHPFWRAASHLNPLFYFINGVRYGLLGMSDVGVWQAFAISVLAFLVFYTIAHRALRKGNYGRW